MNTKPERIWINWAEREFHLKPLADYVEYIRTDVVAPPSTPEVIRGAEPKPFKKLAAQVIDTVVKSPCAVETRFFSQPGAAERLENDIVAILSRFYGYIIHAFLEDKANAPTRSLCGVRIFESGLLNLKDGEFEPGCIRCRKILRKAGLLQ